MLWTIHTVANMTTTATVAFSADSLTWTDKGLQSFIRSQIATWHAKLCRRGTSYNDLVQEMAVVFVKVKQTYAGADDAPSEFFAYLAACCQRRLVDLYRGTVRSGRLRVRDATSCETNDECSVLEILADRHDDTGECAFMLDLAQAPEELRLFVRAWAEAGYAKRPGGLGCTKESFCYKVCGRPWPTIRKLLKDWAAKAFCVS